MHPEQGIELVNEMRDETRQDETRSVVVVVYYYSLFLAFTRTTQVSFPMPSTYHYTVHLCTPFHAPPCTLHTIFSWVFLHPLHIPMPWHTHIPWPMGREILPSGHNSNCHPQGPTGAQP